MQFLFFGHGPERPNMARDLYQGIDSFREDLDQCFDWVREFSGYELKPILFPDKLPEDKARSHMEHTKAVSQEKANQQIEALSVDEEEELLDHAYQRYFTEGSLIETVDSCLETVAKLKMIEVDEIACLIDFGAEEEALTVGLKLLAELQEAVRGL